MYALMPRLVVILQLFTLLPLNDAKSLWFKISPRLACLKNDDGISPIMKKVLDKSIGEGVGECKERCEEHTHCKAIDFLPELSVCLFYAVPCMTPKQGGGVSWAWSDTDKYNPVDLSAKGGFTEAAAPPAHGPPAPAPKGYVPPGLKMENHIADGDFHWEAISETAACSQNLDGVAAIGKVTNLLGLSYCQEQCERRSECSAVDFFADHGICLFYKAACSNPKETTGGAMSFWLKRTATWEEVDAVVPCHMQHNPKTYPLGLWDNCPSVEACREACVRHAYCKAIDFHPLLGYCGFLEEKCNVGTLQQNRKKWEEAESKRSSDDEDSRLPPGSHHKVTKMSGTLTVSELKSWAVEKGRRSKSWEDNYKEATSCEEPWLHGRPLDSLVDDNDSPIDKDYKMDKQLVLIERLKGHQSMAGCLEVCQRTPGCTAVDLSHVRQTCDLRAGTPCIMPSGLFQMGDDSVKLLHTVASVWSAQEKLSMSAHIRWPDLSWESRPRSCEINQEGIKPLPMEGHAAQRKTLVKCKRECEARPLCSAIDYYQATRRCLHYSESCVNPQGSSDIATSHWISRRPLTLQEVEEKRKKKLLLKKRDEEDATVEIRADSGFAVGSQTSSELDSEAEQDVKDELTIHWR